MVDRAAYDSTRVDMRRLQDYAKRVARETRRPPSAPVRERLIKDESYLEEESYGFLGMRTRHVRRTRTVDAGTKLVVDARWVLHATYHNIDQYQSWGHQEYHEDLHVILLRDGSLKKYTKWFEERTVQPSRVDGYSLTEMSVADVERLDFEDRYRETGRHDRGVHTYGNREPGKLIRPRKGMGLSLALKKLLD